MITDKLPEIGDVIGRQNSVDEIILDISKVINYNNKTVVFIVTTNFRDGVNLEISKVDKKYYEVSIIYMCAR